MKKPYDIPEWRKIRLIINSDAKNEADDQFAIVHALLTPRFKIKGIIGAQFETTAKMMGRSDTMRQSYDEIIKLLNLMNIEGQVPVYQGALTPLEDEKTPVLSEGADLIIREAMSEDPTPLYAVFMGPLTDLAAAYLKEPRIAGRLKVIWIGGGTWPEGGWEYNLLNDIHAANVVFGSGIELWQVPHNVYMSMRVTIGELLYKVQPYGAIGDYLFQQMVDFNNSIKFPEWPKGEVWVLGDSPTISLLLDDHQYGYEMKPAPHINPDMTYFHQEGNDRMIRVYHFVDPRFTLEDMFAKLALNYGK